MTLNAFCWTKLAILNLSHLLFTADWVSWQEMYFSFRRLVFSRQLWKVWLQYRQHPSQLKNSIYIGKYFFCLLSPYTDVLYLSFPISTNELWYISGSDNFWIKLKTFSYETSQGQKLHIHLNDINKHRLYAPKYVLECHCQWVEHETMLRSCNTCLSHWEIIYSNKRQLLNTRISL